jgi:hypothetical protein
MAVPRSASTTRDVTRKLCAPDHQLIKVAATIRGLRLFQTQTRLREKKKREGGNISNPGEYPWVFPSLAKSRLFLKLEIELYFGTANALEALP